MQYIETLKVNDAHTPSDFLLCLQGERSPWQIERAPDARRILANETAAAAAVADAAVRTLPR